MAHPIHEANHPIHEANEKCPYGGLPKESFYQKHQVLHQEQFILNHQNMKIFTQSWAPLAGGPRGLVAMVHGYTSESGWLFELTAVSIAKQGFLTVSLDLRGHGRSDGPRTHLPSIEPVVSDCIQVFDSARDAHPSKLPTFLYGESLGGAIAIYIALQQKDKWSGLVLNGAMCGVSYKIKPMWPLELFLPAAAFLAPELRVIFTKPLIERCYKEKLIKRLVRNHPAEVPSNYPTFATALMMTRTVRDVVRRSGELNVAMLVVHGSEDSVCDWESAEFVYNMARSEDKTLKILPGVWHQLVAESEEMVELGFGTIFSWLKERANKVESVGKVVV